MLRTTLIPFQEIPQLSKTDVAYATAQSDLRYFYTYNVDIQSFAKAIEAREQYPIDRELLVEVLQKQYATFDVNENIASNINALAAENTFTVVTAHQPSLLLGPLYFIYKILSTINLSRQLATAYSDKKFVPVFVIGGEDHDFDEVNHANLFGKRLTWENDEKGAVGMMSTATLQPLMEELQKLLGDSENAKEIFALVAKNYTDNTVYHTATQNLIHDLFGRFGLLVLNMNDASLKRSFIPYILKEILEQPSQKIVSEAQVALNTLGYKSQAFPREINLFYLNNQLRERIVFEENQYKVLNTSLTFSEAELRAHIEEYPERFSPNVVLRPLYQEVILPNLAYIGGGGEIAYWLERKAQFDYFGVFYPMLIRRNSVMWLDEPSRNRMAKLDLSNRDLFQDPDALVRQYVSKNAADTLDLQAEKTDMQAIYERIEAIAKRIDPTLEKAIVGERVKQLQSLEQLESRIVRAEKQKHETALNQIRTLVQKFCPNGGLQERYDNFLPYYLKYGAIFFDELLEVCSPLEQGFVVVEG